MSAVFLPEVSSCAWVWHVCICFSKSFESSSWELKRGELKHNPQQVWPHTNWPILCWKADLWGRARMLLWTCHGLKSWSAASGVFCRTAALSLQVFSEEGEGAWLPLCTCPVYGHRGPVMSPLPPRPPSHQSQLRPFMPENSFCIVTPGEDNPKEPNSAYRGNIALQWQGRSLPPWWLPFSSELKRSETSKHCYIKGKLVPSCCLLLDKWDFISWLFQSLLSHEPQICAAKHCQCS